MKRKRPDGEDRRRPLAEINLAQTEKSRVDRLRRTGCFAVLVLPVVALTALIATFSALH